MPHRKFFFDSYDFDEATALLRLNYSYENGPAFEETIQFPAIDRALDDEDRRAIDNACRLVLLLAGVSYYKAFAPHRIACRAFDIDAGTGAFIEKIYRNGLGEFAYVNNLDLSDRAHVAVTTAPPPVAAHPVLRNALCIPVGGGKDSVVSIETLKRSGRPLALFALSSTPAPAEPISACIAASGLPAIVVTRKLSPALIDLNKQGAYNGHIPITAILSAIAVAATLMQGWEAVVMSNEHSASAPNVTHNGADINHQYSKSFEFERDFSAYIDKHVAAGLKYFSLLRPLTEAAIAKRFAAHTAYHPVFRSCNTAFKQDAAQRNKNWCCDCPKCRFVFLALASFMEKQKLETVFGRNMLDDAAQTPGFAALCGIDADKPFECVGEVGESTALLRHLSTIPAWKDDAVVKSIAPRLPVSCDFSKLFALRQDHAVPAEFLRLLA